MARTQIRVASAGLAVVVTLGAAYALNIAPAPATNENAIAAAETTGSRTSTDYVEIDPVLEWSKIRLAEMSLDEKVRSLLVLHIPGLDADAMRAAVAPVSSGGTGAGGLILMRDNVPESAQELSALTSAAIAEPELPPVIAIDQEGGDVVRLPFDEFPGADSLRFAEPRASAEAYGARAALLELVGVNLNFGIVADVTASSGSFIYWRTLGDEPSVASERVAAAVSAESAIIGSTLKHFPGHGRSDADSHQGIPSTDVGLEEWRATDALPFDAGIEAGAHAVMFGHLAYPAVDTVAATLSPAWHEILRTDLGFTGLAITDDMLMLQVSGVAAYADPYANAVAAVAAGNDALLYVMPADPATVGIDLTTLSSVIATGVDENRIDDAAIRMLLFRRALALDALSWRPPCDLECLAGVTGAGVSGLLSNALNQ